MILVDERRLAYGIDPVLVRHGGGDPESVLSPAAFLSRGGAMRVPAQKGERRAMIRRIAWQRAVKSSRSPAHVPAKPIVRRAASWPQSIAMTTTPSAA